MACSESTYDERLRLADSVEEYQDCFSAQHYELLAEQALDETTGGAAKLRYILALARRCKTGAVSRAVLAGKVSKEYSEEESAEAYEGTGTEIDEENDGQNNEAEAADEANEVLVESSDMETDGQDAGDQQADEQEEDDEEEESDGEEEEDEEEEEAPHVGKKVKTVIDEFEHSFFARHRWRAVCKPFILPGAGYWLDANGIEKIRTSTHDDFDVAIPKPMPVYIKGNPFGGSTPRGAFRKAEKNYYLCRRVAVSSDGQVYRATNAEIEAALKVERNSPSCSAATYVKAVQEVRRRHAVTRARLGGSG